MILQNGVGWTGSPLYMACNTRGIICPVPDRGKITGIHITKRKEGVIDSCLKNESRGIINGDKQLLLI